MSLRQQFDLRLVSALKRISRISSAIVIGIAVIVLVAWQFQLELPKSLFPGFATMKANTAIAFLCSSVSIQLLHRVDDRSGQTRFKLLVGARILAVLVLLIGVLNVSQYLFGWDLGIDQLVYRDTSTFYPPGRMSLISAFNFLVLGIALLLIGYSASRRIAIAQTLGSMTLLIALQALIGYLFGAEEFYRFSAYATSIAIHTAVSFFLLSVGILGLRADRGLVQTMTEQGAGSLFARRFLISAIVLPFGLGWIILNLHKTGLYNVRFAFALLVTVLIAGFVILLWRNAKSLNQLDAALKDNEARLQHFFESNIIGLFFAATDGRILKANDEFLRIVGYSVDDLIHDRIRWTELTPPEYQVFDQEALTRTSATGAVDPYEKEYIRKDGSRIPVLIGFSLLGDALQEGICFVLDISDRKRIERDRQALLEREQFAREQAETTNRLKDEFIAVVSHELRSPLNAMLGWVSLLRSRQYDAATTTRALDTIDRNARAQAQLIEDLLDMSRIVQGKLRLNVRQIHPIEAIEAAIETVQPMANAKSIRLQPILDPAAAPISGDPDRLQQIVWNLLTNAIKFTPKGGRVQIRLERINSHIKLIVSDTGQGIPPDFLPFVFDRFRQEDASKTRSHGGLGLGLSIVRHLVELHGGTIQADSPGVNHGATFTVKLPLTAVIHTSEPERIHPAVSTAAWVPIAPMLQGIRVLAIDDEADAREVIGAILQTAGAEVIAVATVEAVITTLVNSANDLPDVLISDIGMPKQDGYEVLRQVRSLDSEFGGRIPAIALTAYARTEDRQAAMMAGFQAHIAKPVEPAELIAVVANLTDRTEAYFKS